MTVVPSDRDRLSALVDVVKMQSRPVHKVLRDFVVPHLSYWSRLLASHIDWYVIRRRVYSESMLGDIEELVGLIEREARTDLWRSYPRDRIVWRAERASDLKIAAAVLRRYRRAIAKVLDEAERTRLARAKPATH